MVYMVFESHFLFVLKITIVELALLYIVEGRIFSEKSILPKLFSVNPCMKLDENSPESTVVFHFIPVHATLTLLPLELSSVPNMGTGFFLLICRW